MKYTEEELLEELKRVSEEHCDGGAPRVKDMREYGEYSPSTFRKRFGSWNKSLKEVGLSPNKEIQVSGKELIEEIKELSEKYCNGGTPTLSILKDFGRFSGKFYIDRFGSWNEAVKKAGFSPNPGGKISDEDLFQEMERVADECSREVPRQEDMEEYGKYSHGPYLDHFGSWNEALRECGFRASTHYNENEIVNEIQKVSEKCGGRPTRREMKKHGNISTGAIRDNLNSWNNALRKAGFKPRNPKAVGEEHYNWKGGNADYGPSWYSQRKKAWQRDEYKCRLCGIGEDKNGRKPSVHHIKPVREWDVEEEHEEMNDITNLITLCYQHHNILEGKWQDCDPDEFEKRARQYLGLEGEQGVKQSVFDY